MVIVDMKKEHLRVLLQWGKAATIDPNQTFAKIENETFDIVQKAMRAAINEEELNG